METNTTETKFTPALEILLGIVKSEIKERTPSVAREVINRLVKVELDKRTEAIIGAVNEATKLDKELSKFKGDVVTFTDDGKELRSWSQAKVDEKKKLVKKLDDLRKAIGAALADEPDYSQVLNKSSDKGDKPTDGAK